MGISFGGWCLENGGCGSEGKAQAARDGVFADWLKVVFNTEDTEELRARRRIRKRKDANWEVGVPRGDDDESVECGGV